jgi:alkylated DNA repair dioxygenase AlkB
MKRQVIPLPQGLYYQYPFINRAERAQIISWLQTLHPLWEMRFSEHNPPPEGDEQRELKRPVYWLGNWQLACLDYYHPPEGILHRCVKAEPYPKFLQLLVDRMEFIAKKNFPKSYIPDGWKLNTCLVNFYGSKIEGDKKVDRARVGEHKDFEPGPVASLSLGDRAFFQFVNGNQNLGDKNNVFSQWLEDSSLQIFGGDLWKNKTFHRVQRVESKKNENFNLKISNFDTRRINFTFRFVPEKHIYPFEAMPANKQSDIIEYVRKLGETSPYFNKIAINHTKV